MRVWTRKSALIQPRTSLGKIWGACSGGSGASSGSRAPSASTCATDAPFSSAARAASSVSRPPCRGSSLCWRTRILLGSPQDELYSSKFVDFSITDFKRSGLLCIKADLRDQIRVGKRLTRSTTYTFFFFFFARIPTENSRKTGKKGRTMMNARTRKTILRYTSTLAYVIAVSFFKADITTSQLGSQ